MIRRREDGNTVRKCHFVDHKSHMDFPVLGWPFVDFLNLRLRKVWHYVYGDVQHDRRGTELASNGDSFTTTVHCYGLYRIE